MRKKFLFIAVLVFLVCLAASPVLASPGLTVGLSGGNGLSPEVSPGENYTQTVLVSIGKDDTATDILIEVLGLGANPDTGIVPLLPEDDKSPYSARTFIQLDKTTLHVEPGETKSAEMTAAIPSDVGNGGRYAILRISTVPPAEGTVKVVSAIVLPVMFTIKGSQFTHTGKITNISTGDIVSGKPVDITTTFQNTGNHHFKFKEAVTVSNAAGETLDTINTALSPSNVIPSLSEDLSATYIPKGELAPGTYTIKSTVMLDDGTVLDESHGSFTVAQPYIPPPSPASITLKPGNASVLETVDKSISISFPKGAVTGQVDISLQNYPATQLPSPPANYTATSTCFRVDGLTGLLAQNATVTVKYTGVDLAQAGGDVSRLTLARWDEATNKWSVLKTKADTSAMTLTAQTNRFSIWAVMVSPPAKTNWPVIGGAIAAGIIIIAALVVVLTRKKARK